MKKIFIILSLLFFISCNDDDNIPDPSVQTVMATLLDGGGVRLFGRVNNLNGASAYGFAVSSNEGSIPNPFSNLVKLEYGEINGEYSIDYRSDLVEGQTYYYKAILEHNGSYILGEEMSFVSNGNTFPLINEVTPQIAHVGDTITIAGKYFSDNFKVYFNEKEAEVLLQSDSLTKAIVPFEYNRDTPYTNLKIKKVTEETTTFDQFSMYTPVVNSVVPYYAHEKDTITIIGDHFNLINEQNRLSMDVFGNYSNLEIIESSRTELKFVNAGWFYDLFPRMKLKSQYQTIDFNDKFQAKLPTIIDAPDCLTYGETATIYGEDFPRVGFTDFNSQFSLQIGGVGFSAASVSRDSIVLNIEDGFYTDFTLQDVTIQYIGQTINFEKEICVSEPWIKVSFENPQHQAHNYQNETYGVVYQNNNTFVTVGKLNTETYSFESVINQQLPEAVRVGNLRAWHEDKMYHYDISPTINKFYSYNFLNGNLVELAPFPGAQRVKGLMTTVGDYIYLGLGRNAAYQPFDDIWRYSITNNTWEFVLTYPGINTSQDAINEPLTFAFGNRLFFGGNNADNNSNSFWEIDLNTFSLLPKSNLPVSAGIGLRGATLNDKGYFESNFLYEYDLMSDQWTTHTDIQGIGFLYPSSSQSLFTNNGNIYRSITTSAPYYSLLFKMNMGYLED